MDTTASPATVEVNAENVEQVLATHGCKGPDYGLLPHRGDFRDTGEDTKNHPLFPLAQEFPMAEVVRDLDGDSEQAVLRPDTDMSRAELVEAFRTISKWMVDTKARDPRGLKSIGIQTLAAFWVINPDLFEGMSACKLAESFRLNPNHFKGLTAEFSRQFRIQNHFQRAHGRNDV